MAMAVRTSSVAVSLRSAPVVFVAAKGDAIGGTLDRIRDRVERAHGLVAERPFFCVG